MATSPGRCAVLLLRLLVLTGLLPLAGCGGDRKAARSATAIALTDDAGAAVVLRRPARRVVSLIPSVNETILALGAGDRIIARTDYDREPALQHLPSLGGGLTPNIEWLAGQRPDLVVAWPDERARSVVGRLRALDIPVYSARVETLADAERTTRNLGRMLALEPAAEQLIARVRGRLDDVRRRAAALPGPRPRVLYLIGLDPPEAAGAGTFVDEMLGVAGGTNVFADLKGWPDVSLEECLRRDPDVVVLAIYGSNGWKGVPDAGALLRAAPGWSTLRAVRAGRALALDPFVANRPGPEAGSVAEQLFGAIHPLARARVAASAGARP